MNTYKEDVNRLHEGSVHVAPDIAINLCIGRNGIFAENHHPFVVKKKTSSGKSIWVENNLAEFNTLDEALQFPGAQSYGSSTLCSSCKKLPSPV